MGAGMSVLDMTLFLIMLAALALLALFIALGAVKLAGRIFK